MSESWFVYELKFLLLWGKCWGMWLAVGLCWAVFQRAGLSCTSPAVGGLYLAPHLHQHWHLVLSAVLTMWVMMTQRWLLRYSRPRVRLDLLLHAWSAPSLWVICSRFLLHFNLGSPFSGWVSRILCLSWINVLYRMCLLQIFSPRQFITSFSWCCLSQRRVCRPAYHVFLLRIVPLVIVMVHLVNLTGSPATKEAHSSGYFWEGVSERFN